MNFSLFVAALIAVESGGRNDHAVGPHGERGVLQITPILVDDVNRITHGALNFTVRDCYNRTLSVAMLEIYLGHYATEERLGRPVTDADRARIWNGGPNGWKSPATVGYARKFERAAADILRESLRTDPALNP